jgi:hypothetical protein
VLENWVQSLLLIFTNHELEGLGSEYLIRVIVKTLMIGGGLLRKHITKKFISLGANNVNVFQSTSVRKQI